MDRIKAVEALGVKISYDSTYEGEVGNGRHRVTLENIITNVFLPFSPEEWCSIAMREGENYIGGCCGNTGAMQDRVQQAFRNSGWIDSEDLLYVGLMARDHDGFDEFEAMDDERFAELIGQWHKLNKTELPEGYVPDAWFKMGVIFSAVEPMLKPRAMELPEKEIDPVHTLLYGLSHMSWEGLFSDRGGEDLNKQHGANGLLTRAKILEPTRQVLAQLEATDERFEGYALVEKGTEELLTNGAGACIYATHEDAEKWLELMNRHDDMEEEKEEGWQHPLKAKGEIIPCTVTVENGLELRR